MSKNLWILTEESVHIAEIKKIIIESSLKHNLDIELLDFFACSSASFFSVSFS